LPHNHAFEEEKSASVLKAVFF